MIPQPNQIYQHFKGNFYKIVTVAEHSETGERLVVYQALYGEFKVYARPLSMFLEEVDRKTYPDVKQKMRFQLVEQIVDIATERERGNVQERNCSQTEKKEAELPPVTKEPKEITIDPMLEAYLDADSVRERLNILQGMHDRITENIVTTMAVAIDVELPEGDLETKFQALKDCLLTKEKYECNRMP